MYGTKERNKHSTATKKKKEFKKNEQRKDGGKIGGSRVHFPLHMGETCSRSTEEQSEQPTAPSIYEDRRPKTIEDTEKTDSEGIASGQ